MCVLNKNGLNKNFKKSLKSILGVHYFEIIKTPVKDKTALHLAAEKGHASVVYALGDAGALMVTQENVDKESPLHRTVLFQ